MKPSVFAAILHSKDTKQTRATSTNNRIPYSEILPEDAESAINGRIHENRADQPFLPPNPTFILAFPAVAPSRWSLSAASYAAI